MLPLGKGRRRIKGHPAHPGRDRPDIQGRFGPRNRFAFCFRNGQAAVVNTVRRQRPAVIFPRLRNINFISAARAMLVQPQRLAPGIHRHALRITDAVSPDLRPGVSPADKRVIRRYTSGLRQADHFPLQLAEILGGGALIIFAQPDKQISFAVEHQPAAKMIADGELRLLAKDHGKVRQLRGILAQPPIAHRGARLTAGVAFRIAQPYPS